METRTQYLRRIGRCTRCGTKPPRAGKASCAECARLSADRMLRRIAGWIASGGCRYCGIKVRSGSACTRCKVRLAIRGRRQLDKKRALIVKAKSKPCTDCKKRYDPDIMDLDHVRGTKKFGFGRRWNSHTMSEIEAEIRKCVVRCPICHRKRHLKEMRRER